MYGIRNPSPCTTQDEQRRIMVGDFRREKFKIFLLGRLVLISITDDSSFRTGSDCSFEVVKGAIRSTGWKNIPKRAQCKYTAPFKNK